MNIKRKEQHYLNAKSIKGSTNYAIDEQGVSLPYEMHFFTHPVIKLDCVVNALCPRSDKDELLLLDIRGNVWRYYSDVETLQKTNLTIYEKVYAIENIGETLILQFKERIEARALSNGQIIWNKKIIPQTSLRKKNKDSLVLYESSHSKATVLNAGGEILSIESFEEENFDLSSNEERLSIETINLEQKAILILDSNLNINKLLSYELKEKKWELKKSLLFNRNNLLLIRQDKKGRVWYLTKEGEIGYVKQSRQYLKANIPLYFQIDSLKHNTRWHRVLMEYNIPVECDIRMEVTASNNKDATNGYISIEQLHKDLLLPELQGQYLFVKIYLIGNQSYQESPTIRNVKVIYPRSTYLEYLPTYYQEDKKSSIILENFLSIFETTFATLEKQRESTSTLIDTAETSKENLAWLSNWLGLTYDESWDINRWRQIMREAPNLFSLRGTREGIERVIEIYSDMRPLIQEPMHTHCSSQWKIVEKINYRKWEKLNENRYKKVALKEIDNYSFCIFLKPTQYKSEVEVNTIRRIVEEWKPAYTKARVVPLEQHMLLGSFVFLGINTKLEKRKSHLGIARMPFGTLALAYKENIRTLEHVRINNDAILN